LCQEKNIVYLDRENISRADWNTLEQIKDYRPVAADCGDGLEAARSQLVRSSEATVHSPVEQIDLIGVQF